MKDVLEKISKTQYNWENATRNVRATPLRFFYPRHKKDLIMIIQEAEQKGLRVRAVGSGHSYSEVAKEEDYLVSMKRLNRVWPTPTDVLTLDAINSKVHYVNVEAGTVLHQLNKELDKMGEEGWALKNMGAVDFQTISGALMTATHGTGVGQFGFPDLVKSLKMVSAAGKCYQVEPSDGITDKNKFDNEEGQLELIQDDETFYSTVMSMGAMGIVYELTLEVVDSFWLEEKRYLIDWKELKAKILSGTYLEEIQKIDYYGFRVSPYVAKGDSDHLCAVVEQRLIEKKDIPKGLGARTRNILTSLFGDMESIIESSINRFVKDPKKIPQTIKQTLKLSRDKRYVNKSYKVLLQSGRSILRYGISSEFAFKLSPETIVKVIEAIFEQAEKNKEWGGLYQSSYIPVRFVKRSAAYLSTAYDDNPKQDTVYFDVPLLYGTTGDLEILERYQEMMLQLGGMPHWGKHNKQLYTRNDFIPKYFSQFNTWKKVRTKFDPKGTFSNDFLIKMGLGKEPDKTINA